MYEQVASIIAEYLGSAEGLCPEANLTTDLGLSSFDAMTLACQLEDAFDVEIPTEDIPGLTTVQSLVDYIQGLKAAQAVS